MLLTLNLIMRMYKWPMKLYIYIYIYMSTIIETIEKKNISFTIQINNFNKIIMIYKNFRNLNKTCA